MNSKRLREKLHQLINTVSDENLPLVFQAVDTAVAPSSNWWENKDVICEFDSRVKSWLENGEKGYSMEDIDKEIIKRKKG
ncbi:hypothetical protein [Sphingobacterium hotanense]|uniref:hypothetical protein n=1 Tax=Sphingobacterium hotanense TaxID=649196 RepID=UPI0021A7A01A|nr:hypothetical protein [Sphingobacterium hotanense]MCT1526838.1 hypothetical protein [Sphingobacterium hotanense]